MSNIEKFEGLLRSDEDLQAKLRAATEAYDGDKADEQAVFEAVVAPLAAEAGLPFTFDEVKKYAASGAELSEDQLAAVAGGNMNDGAGCIFIGFGLGADACGNTEAGVGACAGVGIGFLGW